MEAKREYRIPKHIDQRLRLGGLDVRGWVVVGSLGVLALLILLVTPHHKIHGLIIEFIIVAIPPVCSYIFLSDERVAESFFLSYYHTKHSAILRWESEPNVILEALQKERRKR